MNSNKALTLISTEPNFDPDLIEIGSCTHHTQLSQRQTILVIFQPHLRKHDSCFSSKGTEQALATACFELVIE